MNYSGGRKSVSWQVCITLLLHFGTLAYLFLPDEGSCYIFSTQNNCCEFLAFYGVLLQSDIQQRFKC